MLTHRGATHRIPLHAHLDVDCSQAMIFGAMARQTLTAAVRLQQQSDCSSSQLSLRGGTTSPSSTVDFLSSSVWPVSRADQTEHC